MTCVDLNGGYSAQGTPRTTATERAYKLHFFHTTCPVVKLKASTQLITPVEEVIGTLAPERKAWLRRRQAVNEVQNTGADRRHHYHYCDSKKV